MPRKAEAAFDNSEWYNLLGLNISYYRRRAGLTQEQLADLVGVSRQHIAMIEAPKTDKRCSLELLFNVAKVLQVDPSALLSFRV